MPAIKTNGLCIVILYTYILKIKQQMQGTKSSQLKLKGPLSYLQHAPPEIFFRNAS